MAANLKYSQLPAATAFSALQQFGVNNGGVSEAVTGGQVRQFVSPFVNVLDYGAVGDGTTDDTAAITAADTAAELSGQPLLFPAGRYKHTGLSYHSGIPWVGAGANVTTLDYYGSSVGVDAANVDDAHTHPIGISHLTLDGQHSTGSSIGLQLGNNQRSRQALDNVWIFNFQHSGIFFRYDTFIMSFYDVHIVGCGKTSGAGITCDASVTFVGKLDWFNLNLEQNGQVSSSTGGGLNLDNGAAIYNWTFHGGLIEGNKGSADVRLIDGDSYSFYGMYIESSLSASGAVDGVIIGGTAVAALYAPRLVCEATHGGTAVRIIGTSQVTVDQPFFQTWPAVIGVEDAATCTLTSLGNINIGGFASDVTVASTAVLLDSQAHGYVPTLTKTTNLAATTAYTCLYTRTANSVTVTGQFGADPTSTGNTVLGVSLPIPSDFASEDECAGSATAASGEAARIYADTINKRAIVQWVAGVTADQGWSFSFTYQTL